MPNLRTMNRLLGLVASVGAFAALFVGCSGLAPSNGSDDDGDGNGDGNGGTGTQCAGPGIMMCGPQCTNVGFDPANCGTCGRVCPQGQSCSNGNCACPQ